MNLIINEQSNWTNYSDNSSYSNFKTENNPQTSVPWNLISEIDMMKCMRICMKMTKIDTKYDITYNITCIWCYVNYY